MGVADGAIGVGLIGYGFAGRTFHAPLIGATPTLALAAIASSDPAKVRVDLPDAVVVPDAERLIQRDDVALVVIASPNPSHAALARAALRAGKSVVVDKPFTLDLVEAREVIAEAERAGGRLSVFHNRRWDSDFLSVRRAIEAGLVGRVSQFESHFDRFRPAVRDRWREQAGPGGGVWFDLGPHLIDQALQLFGLPDRILASLARQRPEASVDDWAHVVLCYGERRVLLHASMLTAGGGARFIVHGDQGSLVKRGMDPQERQLLAGLHPGAPEWGRDDDPLLLYDADGRERRLPAERGDQSTYYAELAEALRGHAPLPVTPAQALAVVAVLEAARTAAETGSATEIALTPAERAAFAAGQSLSGSGGLT